MFGSYLLVRSVKQIKMKQRKMSHVDLLLCLHLENHCNNTTDAIKMHRNAIRFAYTKWNYMQKDIARFCNTKGYSGHDVNFCSDLPRRASEIQFSLALLQLSLALEKLYKMIF